MAYPSSPILPPKKTLVILCGPTAIGKTALAINLANIFSTEIISADSRQFYKEMTIGTAKPTEQELKKAKHHLINSLSIYDEYNVGLFEKEALQLLESIFSKQNIAVMVGGSGLYLQAICKGFDEVPSANKEVREQLLKAYAEQGIEYLRTTLKKLDEQHFLKVDTANPHRMIRAIEVCLSTGKKYSDMRLQDRQKDKTSTRPFNILKVGLRMDRDLLYQRINERVDAMMQEGLLEEVENLTKEKQDLNALNTVGYNELFAYLNGKHDLPKAIELIKQHTRNFAKRQLTWFKKDPDIKWFHPTEWEDIIAWIQQNTV
jgi:tRNA dimethylallyltransferase